MSHVHTKRQHKKFDVLLVRKIPTHARLCTATSVASKQLEGSHLSALSKCLNFAPAPARIPTTHIMANVEAAIGRAKASESVAAKVHLYIIGAIH